MCYDNICMTEIPEIQFLGIKIDSSLKWRGHVDSVLPKLSSAVLALRKLSYILNLATLYTVYMAYFHSLIKFEIILWGNLPNPCRVFKLQKRVIRIILKLGPRVSCREGFRRLQILTILSVYIFTHCCHLW
jgi:hypothetical protein